SVIDGTVNDQADPLRKAISNQDLNNSTLITFPPGFEASHAIGIEVGFAGLWSIPPTGTINDNGLGFIDSANSDLSAANQAIFSFSIDWSELGLTSSSSFDFVGIYLNPGNAFTSDEAYGDGIPPGNPGGGAITYTAGRTYSNTLGLNEQGLNDYKVVYSNDQLIINNLNGNFDLRIYDMLGKAILSLEDEMITPNYSRPLNLEKGQVYILQIQNDAFRKTLKLLSY
ncbi:MAG: T9SS type A sorting domain-containing protein, partial [Bacteroidia bacterium]|nr:T9SS type A sorting domain-containing protein [Bacteroidia bacterium]